jgi:hypothetical protein
VEMLDRLVARVEYARQRPGELRAAIEEICATRDFFADRPSEHEYKALLADIVRQFREVVAAVEADWGPTDAIENERGRPLVPPMRPIEEATWLRGEKRDDVAAVYYEHEDNELPIVLALGAIDLALLKT